MNTKTLTLLLALFTTAPAHANEITLRYGLEGELALEMEQEIFVGDNAEAIAGRVFSLSFAVGDGIAAGQVPVELSSARASYTAHGMKQRLPASHLVGTGFTLLGSGRVFSPEDAGPAINLGQITDGGLQPAILLAGLLPELPAEPVMQGSTWLSLQTVETLVGWSWAHGEIVYENEIIQVRESGEETIVTVRSSGTATLRAAEGRSGFVGEGTLARAVEWSFAIATGRLLEYSLEQEATGTSQVPQGEVPVRQVSRITLHGS